MIPPGANRFLDCVLHRGGRDAVLSIVVMLFAVIGIPGFILYQLIPLYFDYGVEFRIVDIYTYVLFMSVLVSFFTFIMTWTVVRHHKRDVEWMGALLEYAKGQGVNTIAMEPLYWNMKGLVDPWLNRYMFAAFMVLMTANIVQSIMWFGEHLAVLELIVIFFVLINLCIADVYVLHKMRAMDSIQIRFMHSFCDAFLSEQPVLEEMVTGIEMRSLWPHVLLMTISIGTYSLFFSMWCTHVMNVHIKEQWRYEEKVIRWMMARHDLDSITVREHPFKPNLFYTIYRII